MTELVLTPFDEAALYRAFVAAVPATSGAVVSFTGRMRGADAEGAALERLVLEHHPERTAESLRELAERTAAHCPVDLLQVIHRAGAVAPGEAIVWVAAAAAHRRAAFDAVDQLMDRLKTEAVLWKREEGPRGRRWIEPCAGDHSDRARWED
ncbi:MULTISPECIES: molybdenum cofactor biosynthesis protein MoaE [Sphingomonas]|uniref:molybdenum cofactor biosynthesis protein MoaE n=1 Tax=Sphingomonas TaxID=13687 RepID=UPI001966C879|nr:MULTISPECIES: molybdenum cofactor biosynthesis protein MoaE [Sphingomonas]